MARLAWALAAWLSWPATAAASTGFPAEIEAHLDLAAAPPCDVCHGAPSPPVGPVDRPFGLAAVARGLVADDAASLRRALDALRADAVDSDGDGARDVDELGWGGDPNTADLPKAALHEPPTYGCGVAGGASPGELALPLCLALGALALSGRGGRLRGARVRWGRGPRR